MRRIPYLLTKFEGATTLETKIHPTPVFEFNGILDIMVYIQLPVKALNLSKGPNLGYPCQYWSTALYVH